MKKKYNITFILIFLICAAIITGCSSSDESPETTKNATDNESESYTPVTVQNAGRKLTFEEPPKRVVALYQQEAELMAALGLEDKLAGYSITADNTPAKYEKKLKDVPVLAEDDYPSKEVLLKANPDFVIGSERTFNKNGVGSVKKLKDLGITAYVTESKKPETIENMVYKEVNEISRIFGVEDRGKKLIKSMKSKVDDITDQVDDVDDPKKVLIMSGAESGSAQVSGGSSLDSYLIKLAGGENIFSDEDKYLLNASWEEIVERDPDVIVLSYCCGTKPEDLKEAISNNPSLKNVTAVKNKNYIALPVEDTTGNVRVTRGLETLAEGLYPQHLK